MLKNTFSIIILFLLLNAFNTDQLCFDYFPSKVGTYYEMTNYSEKGKITSIVQGTLLESKIEGSAQVMKIGTNMVDDKGKEIITGSYIVKCENDKLYMDMSSMLPGDMMKGLEGMEIQMSNGFMELPSNPVSGQKLNDAHLSMSVSTNGVSIMNMRIDVTDRVIDGFETINTTAGSFECVKYSETITTKSFMSISAKSSTWIAKNIGTVKNESYNEKGNLQGYSLLTAFK